MKLPGWLNETIESPEWHATGRVHDWRNYIPEEMRSLWNDLSFDARVVAYFMAERQADREEWD